MRFGNAGRTLRYRKLLVRQNVQLKNKIAQLLMESGVSYNKEKLHQQGYFHQILPANPEIDPSLWSTAEAHARDDRAHPEDRTSSAAFA